MRPVRITPTRPVVRVTVPASTLLGLDDAPGHLTGYGPIPADTARLIANDATWQRLLTDPVTGILTDYSTTTYQPGKVLRTAVETRDETCTFLWGCDTPATRCDLDHIQPFDHEHRNERNDSGQTNAHNLHPLCRKHHLLKTHAGWGIVRDPLTGVTTWTTPTGRTHTRPPTVLDTHIDLDHIDPDTSHDLTLHALTGQHLPRSYQTTEPGAVPTDKTDPAAPTDPGQPPF
ncbi:HNH endonuclease signature motif containing protein [Promicromonospora vindobonensis]|uniref:HNH endonuclease signature motif containing protein n=1 Tax=Promicromonospora vindobonensis TaxID=195748 RepID=A0ABW5VV53_9MICO